jgi:hypothetical protein
MAEKFENCLPGTIFSLFYFSSEGKWLLTSRAECARFRSNLQVPTELIALGGEPRVDRRRNSNCTSGSYCSRCQIKTVNFKR